MRSRVPRFSGSVFFEGELETLMCCTLLCLTRKCACAHTLVPTRADPPQHASGRVTSPSHYYVCTTLPTSTRSSAPTTFKLSSSLLLPALKILLGTVEPYLTPLKLCDTVNARDTQRYETTTAEVLPRRNQLHRAQHITYVFPHDRCSLSLFIPAPTAV